MRSTSFLFTSLLLAGCASSPSYRAPEVPTPHAFRERLDSGTAVSVAKDTAAVAAADSVPNATPEASGPPVTRTEFWRELGDTTLDRLITELAGANLDVRSAAARVRGARAARTEAGLDLAPIVTFGGGYTRQRLSSATFPIGAGSFPDQDIWDGGFDASWEIDLFGRLRRTFQAQGATVEAAREDLRDVQVSLTAELARAYFELRGAQEQLSVATHNGENQRKTLEVTQQRFESRREIGQRLRRRHVMTRPAGARDRDLPRGAGRQAVHDDGQAAGGGTGRVAAAGEERGHEQGEQAMGSEHASTRQETSNG